MDLRDTPEEAAFRREARAWLERNVGPYRVHPDGGGELPLFADAHDTAHVERGRAWQRVLYEAGWAGLGWPRRYGGRELPVPLRLVWAQEAAAAGVPPGINLIGEGIAGPTIIAHGDEEQKLRYLRPLLRGDEIWCQLFSEPGAGSDLAAVATSAVRDGDGWVVNGHKLWVSGAHYADFGILLARTDWDAPKHRGCTYLLVDMTATGVTARPLRQMTGRSLFNEVLLHDVRVPDDQRLGAVGDGWRVAVTTLMHERLSIGTGLAATRFGFDRVLDDVPGAADAHVRQLAAQLYIDSRCLQFLGHRVVTALAAGQLPGPEGSVAKLATTRLARQADRLLDAIRGARAMVVDRWTELQLWVPAVAIAGGTDEVLKNVIGERVLGLPAEPRPDRDVPFRDLPRQGDASWPGAATT